jgi:purine nucleosidase
VLACFLLLFAAAAGGAKTSVVLSTDVGNEVDDQWAITYLLTNPEFQVEGIISALAPSLPDPSAHASYEILRNAVEHHLGLVAHPPLFEGSSTPLKDIKTPSRSAGMDFLLRTAQRYSASNRLTVLTIGAATDVASALLTDPGIADKIRVVAMGFTNLSAEGGKEFNVENDPHAWQAILQTQVPVIIGSGDVCRKDLALGYEQARQMMAERGAVGAWLWREYREWYFRAVKPLRVNDFSKPWIIWDIITLAYVQGMTTQKDIGRPILSDALAFQEGSGGTGKVQWITSVDSTRLWKDFLTRLDAFQATHETHP